MESCSTSEVGGEEGLGAFKGRIEPGTRKLRGDGRDKEKMEKWTREKKEKPGRASKRERTDRRWRARFEGSAARWMHCFSMRLSWVLSLVRGHRYGTVQCSAVELSVMVRAAGRRGHTAGKREMCVTAKVSGIID